MTKKEMVEALKGLGDDEEIRLLCFFNDGCFGEYLHNVRIFDEDGLQDGITLVGHY